MILFGKIYLKLKVKQRNMSERKLKKKELARWIAYRNSLPSLIDCSRVYGDYTYTNEDLVRVDAEIDRIKGELGKL